MNPKLVKNVSKLAVGAIGSALLGYLYKGEQLVENRIDDYFDKTDDTEQPVEA